MMEHTRIGPGEFFEGRYPRHIDLPQRFGEDTYVEADLGESSVRFDHRGLAAGFSTANQNWGPANHHPLVLGDNAPGFPHAFLETSRPANVGIGRVQARIFWGRLSQSDFSPVVGDSSARFSTGVAAVFTPKGAPNVEIGAARFFQVPWTANGLKPSLFVKTFEGLLKVGIPGKDIIPDEWEPDRPFDPDNQIASIFFRWGFPDSDFEVYGEYARDDHSWDWRDLALEPDHISGYVIGLGKVWPLSQERLLGFRAEVLDTQIKYLDRVRPQAPFYVHAWTRQGHTNRGQLLGSAAFGGSAAVINVDYYHPDGALNASWTRELRQTSDRFWYGEEVDEQGLDVQHAFGAEFVQFRSGWDLMTGMTAVYNFNRNFGGDQLNLRASVGVRAPL